MMRGTARAVLVKVAKLGQNMRFDVPIIGAQTVAGAAEAGPTLLLGNRTSQSRELLRHLITACNAGELPIANHGTASENSHLRGVLAQLVERLNGIEEVRGSNPLGSTRFGYRAATPALSPIATTTLPRARPDSTCATAARTSLRL